MFRSGGFATSQPYHGVSPRWSVACFTPPRLPRTQRGRPRVQSLASGAPPGWNIGAKSVAVAQLDWIAPDGTSPVDQVAVGTSTDRARCLADDCRCRRRRCGDTARGGRYHSPATEAWSLAPRRSRPAAAAEAQAECRCFGGGRSQRSWRARKPIGFSRRRSAPTIAMFAT